MAGQPEFQKRLQAIESLLGRIETAGDPELKADVRELVQTIMDLHGNGLERLLSLIGADTDQGTSLILKLSRDELVGSLLVLYGLHPKTLDERVAQALDKARTRLRSHQADLELTSMEGGELRLRVHAHGHGCGSNAHALREIVEDCIYGTAPDVTALIIEVAEDEGARTGFVPVETLLGKGAPQHVSGDLVLSAAENV